MPVNYAVQYGRELANAYPYLSYFGDLYGQEGARFFRPLSGATVMIPFMTVNGARNANREQITGVFNRNFNVAWQACQLDMYREWDTLVDPMDMVETNEVATISNVTRTFNEQQKVPEMDAYAASKLAGFASAFGGTDTTSLNASNILAQWDAYLAYMTDQRINRDRVVAKMTPDTYKLLKEAAGISRFIDAGTGIRNIDRNVGKLDGVNIMEVPSDIMKSAFDFDIGWTAADGAKNVDMILYAPDAISAPVVYETSMISAPTANSKGKWLYYEAYYYGLFALNQRNAGVFAHLSSAASLGTLSITSVAGSAAGATVINGTGYGIDQNGHPFAGLDMYITSGNNSAPSVSYGSALPDGVTWAKIAGLPQTLTSQTASKYVTVALVNAQTGKAVAAGSATEVVGV